MEQIVKQTREVGTSAGVLLPRAWLNKEVVVTLKDLDERDITRKVFEILLEKDLLKDVKGIYLIGSYARGDYDADSDVDVLVVTNKVSKVIDVGRYEVTLVSEEKFRKGLSKSLYGLHSVKYAKSIINDSLLEEYRKVKSMLNVSEWRKEALRVIRINESAISDCEELGKRVYDGTIYSLVLRIRECIYMKELFGGKVIRKKDFLETVGGSCYEAYLRVKRNKESKEIVSVEAAKKLSEVLKKCLKEIKG